MKFIGLKLLPRRRCISQDSTICETEDGRRLYVCNDGLAELGPDGKAKPKPPVDTTCPKCGEPFDPREHTIYECPRCGCEGSTKCCNPGGNNCLCAECEEGA